MTVEYFFKARVRVYFSKAALYCILRYLKILQYEKITLATVRNMMNVSIRYSVVNMHLHVT